jgi:hypothetical protein
MAIHFVIGGASKVFFSSIWVTNGTGFEGWLQAMTAARMSRRATDQ